MNQTEPIENTTLINVFHEVDNGILQALEKLGPELIQLLSNMEVPCK